MKNALKVLEPNTAGRDFVVGDLHGSYSAFVNLLANLNFDATVDRVISVGDLVDRGPESQLCLELLREPWFHAVLSNHEQMMLEAFFGGYMGQYWFMNGGVWGIEAINDFHAMHQDANLEVGRRMPSDSSAELFSLLELVKELPYLITIKMEDGKKFHVLHAELPPCHPVTDETLADPEQIKKLAMIQTRDGECLLWGRYLFYSFFDLRIENTAKTRRIAQNSIHQNGMFNDQLSHIISGHTIVRRPITLLGQTNIDTGAYNSYSEENDWAALTCVELGTWKFYQATERTFREVEPFVVNKADLEILQEPA